MIRKNRPRWLAFVFVFITLTFVWTTLAAAAPRIPTDTAMHTTFSGWINPGNGTFGITIGAIVLVTIVITSTLFRKREYS